MKKHKSLFRVVLFSSIAVQSLASHFATAGSIVINNPPQPQPKKLSIVDDGQTYETELTWFDLKLSAAIKVWLDNRFGSDRSDYPYLVDQKSRTVSVLVDRESGRYEVISFESLIK